MAWPDHLSRQSAKYRKYAFAVGCLRPFFLSVYVIGHGIADTVGDVFPIASAEHFVVTVLVLQYEWPFDSVPSHATFFRAIGIVHLPIVTRSRDGASLSCELER